MREKKKFNEKRRAALKKSLKGAAAAGGVITAAHTWEKPVVESMVLPAHAQTSMGALTISNITITESACSDCGVPVNVDDPTSGTSIGAFVFDGSADSGTMDVNGILTPPPPPGTVVDISATTLNQVDSANDNCFFESPDPCSVSVPVNSTNGDFSLAGEAVNGMDDGSNVVTVTLSAIGAPPFVITFDIV